MREEKKICDRCQAWVISRGDSWFEDAWDHLPQRRADLCPVCSKSHQALWRTHEELWTETEGVWFEDGKPVEGP